MKIILIRHGDAGAYTHPDSERNLSELGQSQAQQTADWLTQHYQPTLFISSPYNRAYQTCEIVKQNFSSIEHIVFEHITPEDNAKDAINGLADIINLLPDDSCVVIVCHMGIIANMVAILTDTTPEGFNLAEARVLETEVFVPDLAKEIDRFVPTA